jgi:hypothetical protein
MANLSFRFLANDKGLRDGIKRSQKGLSGFEKTTKKVSSGISKALGGFGIALGASALISGLTNATKAAAEDLKQQKLLAGQLVRTTKATKSQVKGAEKFIDTLSNQTGILDDDLRPALANAVRGSGSLEKGQKLLQIALDGSVASGKPLDTVLNALIKANNGNTQSLYKLAPELKKTKGGIDDYAKSVKGAAEAGADPFAKFNVAVENLTEQFGMLLLPYVEDFVEFLTKKVVPAISDFLDDVNNPKTDTGKTFKDIGDAVNQVYESVKDFFALFGNGDAAKGFGNVATALVKALPALLALKGILVLASAGKAIAGLVAAVSALQGGTAAGAVAAGGAGKGGKLPIIGFNAPTLIAAGVLTLSGDTQQDKPLVPIIPKVANSPVFGQLPVIDKGAGSKLSLGDFNRLKTNNYMININKANMSPNEIIAAIKAYERSTGTG